MLHHPFLHILKHDLFSTQHCRYEALDSPGWSVQQDAKLNKT